MPEMVEAGPSTRLYTPPPQPAGKRARAKNKLQSAKKDAQAMRPSVRRSRASRVSEEWRHSLVEDDTGELHDPEYTHFRNAAPAPPQRGSRSSSVSSISSIEGGFGQAYSQQPATSRYGDTLRLPGLNGVTTGAMPASPLSSGAYHRAGVKSTSSAYSTSRSYAPADTASLYPGTIAADSSYNPYQYRVPRYDKHTFDPPPPIREVRGAHRPRSITPSEPSELAFESAYIPTLHQPQRHRSRPMPMMGAAREEQDAMDAGCYSLKRAFQATKLDFRFAILRWKRRSGMR